MEEEGELITGLEDCACIETKILMITFIVAKKQGRSNLKHTHWVFLKESKRAELTERKNIAVKRNLDFFKKVCYMVRKL